MNYGPEYLAARRARPIPVHVHGTKNGYSNYACRCTDCRDANTRAVRDRRYRKRAA